MNKKYALTYAYRTEQRIRTAKEYRSTMACRTKIRTQFFAVHWQARPPTRPLLASVIKAKLPEVWGARLGVIVAKRYVRLAVERNQIKRICREAFRLRATQLPAIDLVVRWHQPLKEEAAKGLLRQDLEALFNQLQQQCV